MSLYLTHIYLNLEFWKCGDMEIWKHANDISTFQHFHISTFPHFNISTFPDYQAHWRHVLGEQNPADDAKKGQDLKKLIR